MMVPRHTERGFSLIEMIVVLVVVSLLVGLVVTRGPAHSQALDLDAAARHVVGTLRVAHARAIADERPVLVRFASNAVRLDSDVPMVLPTHVTAAGSAAIDFTPDGGSSGGSVILQAGRRRVTIAVDYLTGHITVEAGAVDQSG
jgi:general secretion pathway protein H